MHDEYAQQLMEGVPIDPTYDHNSTDLDIKPTDSEQLIMYKIYRRKLQYFLKVSFKSCHMTVQLYMNNLIEIQETLPSCMFLMMSAFLRR